MSSLSAAVLKSSRVQSPYAAVYWSCQGRSCRLFSSSNCPSWSQQRHTQYSAAIHTLQYCCTTCCHTPNYSLSQGGGMLIPCAAAVTSKPDEILLPPVKVGKFKNIFPHWHLSMYVEIKSAITHAGSNNEGEM